MKNDYLSCEDVANLTGKTLADVRRWCKSGRLKASRPGGRAWIIKKSDFEDFLRELAEQERREAKERAEIMSCADVVRITGASKKTVWSWCNTGKLKASRPGGRDYIIKKSDFEDFMSRDNFRRKEGKNSD